MRPRAATAASVYSIATSLKPIADAGVSERQDKEDDHHAEKPEVLHKPSN